MHIKALFLGDIPDLNRLEMNAIVSLSASSRHALQVSASCLT